MSSRSGARQWLWYLASLVAMGLAVAYTMSFYPAMPDPFPTHWGPGGEADAFREKSVSNVLMLVLLGPVITFVPISIVAVAMGEMVKRGPKEATRFESQKVLDRRHRLVGTTLRHLGWYQFLVIGFLLVEVVYSIDPTTGDSLNGVVFWSGMGVLLVATASLIVILARVQIRVDREDPPDNYDPAKLKAGMIYWDPEDERSLIDISGEGFNMVPNLGRPGAWGIMGALLLPALVVTAIAIFAG